MLGLPQGRDWDRYWLPLLEYFNAVHGEHGVIWQVAGGVLPSYDPSSLTFDPLMWILNHTLVHPLPVKLYLCTLLLISMTLFTELCLALGANALWCFICSCSYVFGGLSMAVVGEQFIPIYYHIPIFSFFIHRTLQEARPGKALLFGAALSTYYLAYSAVPGIALLCIVAWGLAATQRKRLSTYAVVLALAAPFIAAAYWPLIRARLTHITPLLGDFTIWSFHPIRLISMAIPEPMQMAYWFNHRLGQAGSQEAYFRAIHLPMAALVAPAIYAMHIIKNRRLDGPGIFFLLLSLTGFFFSTVGFWPSLLQKIFTLLPFFSFRYPEKFLLLAFPTLLIGTSVVASRASLKAQAFALLCMMSIILGTALAYARTIPSFLAFLHAYGQLPLGLLAIQIALILIASLAALTKYRNIYTLLMAASIFTWLPFSILNGANVFKFDAAASYNHTGFIGSTQELVRGQTLFIAPSALFSGCQARKDLNSDLDEPCTDHGFYSGRFSFTTYSNVSNFSFHPLAALRTPFDDLGIAIANLKPRFVILSRYEFPKEFCNKLVENLITIKSCKLLYKNTDESGLALLELEHLNTFAIDPSTTPFRLDVILSRSLDQIRIPFVVPPGGWITNKDGKKLEYKNDAFGIILDKSSVPVGQSIAHIHYDRRVLKESLLATLLCTIFISAPLLVLLMKRKWPGLPA
jgi:hypothetical protein